MHNETWLDWMIQCDMLQDATNFDALTYLYHCSFPNHLLYLVGSKHRTSKDFKEGSSCNFSFYSFTMTRLNWHRSRSGHTTRNIIAGKWGSTSIGNSGTGRLASFTRRTKRQLI